MSEASHEKKQFGQHNELFPITNIPSNFTQNLNSNYHNTDLSFLNNVLQIDRSQVETKNFIGGGAFGNVYEAWMTINNAKEKVAIKTLRTDDAAKVDAFLKEAELMSNFKHPNILELKAICINNNPMFLVLELMKGDLSKYLRINRPRGALPSQLNLSDLIEIAIDVAKGCVYLEEQNYVHRDLATRNCLIKTEKVKEFCKFFSKIYLIFILS